MSLASQTLSSEQDRARWGTKVLDDAILFIKQYIGLDQMSRQEVLRVPNDAIVAFVRQRPSEVQVHLGEESRFLGEWWLTVGFHFNRPQELV